MNTRKIVLGVVLGAILATAIGAYRFFEVCAADSRAALLEPQPFGGAAVDADPNILDSGDVCSGAISTTAPAGDVISHYDRELTRLGWGVRLLSEREIVNQSGCHEDDQTHCPTHHGLTAMREELCYRVNTEHYPGSVPQGTKRVYLDVRDC